MAEGEKEAGGLFSRVRQVVHTVAAAIRNRVDLFALELREEECRQLGLLLLAAAVIFFGMMAAIFLTLTLVLVFWDQALYLLIGFTLVYLIAAAWAALTVRKRLKKRPPPFSGTLAELKKDLEWLSSGK